MYGRKSVWTYVKNDREQSGDEGQNIKKGRTVSLNSHEKDEGQKLKENAVKVGRTVEHRARLHWVPIRLVLNWITKNIV